MMNEELMQYIWQAGLFNANGLKTTEGQEIIIYKRGKINTDSGPDFSGARVRIEDTEWVGNIELHLDGEDWYRHKHHEDKTYNNTILHVVLKNPRTCTRADGTAVPCVDIGQRIRHDLVDQYEMLKFSTNWVPCAALINKIDQFTITQVMDRVLVERLERKTGLVEDWLSLVNNDWQSVFYFSIARSFGFGTNSEAFEQLALHLPLSVLGKHRNDLEATEALVLGTSGFLEKEKGDAYYIVLKRQWDFLKAKYKLRSLGEKTFKFMRMRPGNFPTLRLAQLSALIHKNSHLLSSIADEPEVANIISFFKVEASTYWKTHYHFGKETEKSHNASLSQAAIELILINAVVPVLFVYGKAMSSPDLCTKAVNILYQLPPENNHIISKWSQYGLHARSAFDSQALLELKKNNCDERKCLSCKIGNKVMNL